MFSDEPPKLSNCPPIMPKCPKCDSSESVIKIIYGKPCPALQEEATKGLVYLGGCCPKPGINFHCKKCNESLSEPK